MGRDVCILRMEGTNNEFEAFNAFQSVGCSPHYVHLNHLRRKQLSLNDFSCIFLPGGFSAGDYIRAGAIFANRLNSSSGREIREFVDTGKPVVGICNGFQVLSELDFLPDLGIGERSIALGHNDTNRYECRLTFIKRVNKSPILNEGFPTETPFLVPVAHAEGKVVFKDHEVLQKLIEQKQVLFKYCNEYGEETGFPWNPNGTVQNIAGISNVSGNVMGLMPHPERLMDSGMALPTKLKKTSIGLSFFRDLKRYMEKF